MLGGYGALMSELYPTSARATAQNVFFNIGRAVAGFGPLAVGALSASYGFATAIALFGVVVRPRHRRAVAAGAGAARDGAELSQRFSVRGACSQKP